MQLRSLLVTENPDFLLPTKLPLNQKGNELNIYLRLKNRLEGGSGSDRRPTAFSESVM